MVIVLATDDCFAQHCAVAMRSVLEHNEDVEFYILTEGLTEDNARKLQFVAGSCAIHICKVENSALKNMPMPEKRTEKISVATYYRLFILELLPQHIDKVIYLDCDIVVRGSLQELWNTDVADKALAAVRYPDCPSMKRTCERLNMTAEIGYFNAGVLLMNLEYWRIHDLPKRYFDFISEGQCQLLQRDQDVLNAVTGQETLSLPWKYNVMSNELELIKEIVSGEQLEYVRMLENLEPVIVHFSFRLKPWEFGCRNPYKADYRRTLKRTPYRDASLQFSWFDFCEFWIKPVIIHPVLMMIKGRRENKTGKK